MQAPKCINSCFRCSLRGELEGAKLSHLRNFKTRAVGKAFRAVN